MEERERERELAPDAKDCAGKPGLSGYSRRPVPTGHSWERPFTPFLWTTTQIPGAHCSPVRAESARNQHVAFIWKGRSDAKPQVHATAHQSVNDTTEMGGSL